MIKLNIHEAKTHLSRYLDHLARGETILLCKRNEPIAEIRPLPRPIRKPRPLGLAKDQFKVPAEFFEPLPEEDLEAFAPKPYLPSSTLLQRMLTMNGASY